MIYIKTSLLLSFVVLSTQAQNTYYLDLNRFHTAIQNNHPIAHKAANAAKIGTLKKQAAEGNYDPAISGNLQIKQFNGKNYYTRANAEIKQALFANQYLKLGYEYGEGLYINPELNTPQNGLGFVGFDVGLLQGLTIDKRRSDFLKSKAYLQYYDADSKAQFNELLFLSTQTYFYWLYASKIQQLNSRFLHNARLRNMALQTMAENGEKAPIDTVEAAMIYQSRQIDCHTAGIELLKSEKEVLRYLWTQDGPEALNMNATIRAVDSLESHYLLAQQKYAQLNFKNAATNPNLLKYKALRDISEIDVRYRKELRKPQLNLQYNLLSSLNVPNRSVLLSNYKWALQFQMPLIRQTKNDHRLSITECENVGLELDDKTSQLNAKLSAAHQSLGLLAEQIMLAERSVRYGQQMLEAEKWRFENGESSLFLLNTRENKWLESELKLATYKLKFISTILQIVYLEGNLNYFN